MLDGRNLRVVIVGMRSCRYGGDDDFGRTMSRDLRTKPLWSDVKGSSSVDGPRDIEDRKLRKLDEM